MGPTILFTQLKIILLQCFQFSVFSFQFSATMRPTQDPLYKGSDFIKSKVSEKFTNSCTLRIHGDFEGILT